MDIRTEKHGRALVAMPEGRIDSRNGEDFRDSLMTLMGPSEDRLVVDLGRLAYIGSAGIAGLVATGRALGAQASGFGVCSLSGPLREVFRISGIDQVVAVADSVEQALADGPPPAGEEAADGPAPAE